MQVMQNVARRYGLVCLLHEKPFAGVNGSGKHNNWSMGTDTGYNLLEPGDTPHENLQFLFFCAAVIQAVDKHQAAAARVGRQRRPGPPPRAPTRRRRRSSRSSSAPSWRRSSTRSRPARATRRRRRPTSGSARRCCRRCPMHGGDRNRTSPFAFTGNKFEFRALGSSHVAGAARTRCSTRSSPRRSTSSPTSSRQRVERRRRRSRRPCSRRQATSTRAHKRIVFGGDNYSERVARRGRAARAGEPAQTPDALPWLVEPSTVDGVRASTTCCPSASSSRATRCRSSST